jgi:hypothetical protein
MEISKAVSTTPWLLEARDANIGIAARATQTNGV